MRKRLIGRKSEKIDRAGGRDRNAEHRLGAPLPENRLSNCFVGFDDAKYCWPGLVTAARPIDPARLPTCAILDTIIIELERMGLWLVLVPGVADADQKNGD
jgi:hypothetical protein